MSQPKVKPVITKMDAICPTPSRAEVQVRDLEVVIDAPEAFGGTNLGPTPPEGLLASLIGCTNVIACKIAAKHGATIDSMKVDLAAQFDRAGALLMEEIDVPFPEITLKIDMETSAENDVIEIIKRDLMRYCPVAKVMRQAGTKIIEEWTVSRP